MLNNREDPIPSYLYSVSDVLQQVHLGNFQRLSGGEMTVSMISYNTVLGSGASQTHYFPGHTTYGPVKLARAMDSQCKYIYEAFLRSPALLRTNFSISMIDHQGNEKVIWNLINAIPTSITGMNFGQDTSGRYAEFEVSIQAERIEMDFR